MSPPSTSQPTTFHLFPHLPLELRTEIWSLSLPPPRLIHVQTEKGEIRIPGRHPNKYCSHVWAKRLPVPSILHTCRDARVVGLKHYELLFDTNCRPAKEDLPDLHDLPLQRGGGGRARELIFPFERKALMYVDLQRDYIVTSHRRINFRRPPTGWPKDEMEDPRFAAWPVQQGFFRIETFREVVPEEVYTRIRNFAAAFMFSLNEIFNRRLSIGMTSGRRVLVIRDPFVTTEQGSSFIDALQGVSGGSVPGLSRKGRVRSLVNLGELRQVVDDGTLWDWVVDRESDERVLREQAESDS
ncbi:hypothetical protein BKA64DRAFT_437261 [Cadophora sp. MPI-SDFR-AT-0126]|nr:hypothetical protein BKA64DRAFT_437261 [Leotiomycetes sp. MPI-SDFR-AT-0126]